MSESFWWGKDVGRVGMGMVTISFKTGGREGFEPINDSRPSLCATACALSEEFTRAACWEQS